MNSIYNVKQYSIKDLRDLLRIPELHSKCYLSINNKAVWINYADGISQNGIFQKLGLNINNFVSKYYTVSLYDGNTFHFANQTEIEGFLNMLNDLIKLKVRLDLNNKIYYEIY